MCSDKLVPYIMCSDKYSRPRLCNLCNVFRRVDLVHEMCYCEPASHVMYVSTSRFRMRNMFRRVRFGNGNCSDEFVWYTVFP